MGTESWIPEGVIHLSNSSMANLALVLLLTLASQALADDELLIQEAQPSEVTIREDFKSMMLMQKRDLEIVKTARSCDTVISTGEHKLSIGDCGVFTSPNYPADYPHNAYAKYILRCVGGTIKLSCFTRIRVSPGCKKDKLSLCRGKGFNQCTRYCGRNDKLLGTYKDRVKAVFKSDATSKNKGFACSFKCE